MTTPEMSPNANGDSNAPLTVTVRMIMQGKEVGSIIGKKGDHIKQIREDSGAKINISDGSCPERIVTITGTTDTIYKAFDSICRKFEEDVLSASQPSGVPRPPITFRMIVPASQCGSLIGKGGSKIKEIREVTGASIQVASEMLPNSTERAVTVSGTADALAQCIINICQVLTETPPKGATIPYRPKPAMPPLIFSGGQAYAMPGHMTQIPQPEMAKIPQLQMSHIQNVLAAQGLSHPGAYIAAPMQQPSLLPGNGYYQLSCSPQASEAMKFNNGIGAMTFGARPTIPAVGSQSHEMTIPNDLIGCIIGRGGQKINEIRQLSGASIKIANIEEGSMDRKVTIMGSPETINMAQYLINTSMELHKNANLDLVSSTPSTLTSTAALTSVNSQPSPPLQLPLASMVKQAQGAAMAPLPYMGLGGLPGYIDINSYQKSLISKLKTGMIATPNTAINLAKASNKFAPY